MSDLSATVKLQTNKEKRNKMNKHTAMNIRLTIVVAILTFITYRLAVTAMYGSPESMMTALSQMFSVTLGIFAGIGWIAVAVNFVCGEDAQG